MLVAEKSITKLLFIKLFKKEIFVADIAAPTCTDYLEKNKNLIFFIANDPNFFKK